MHPSESVGSGITPGTFDGSGYRSWRRGMLRALSVKNKMGFVNGKCKKPAQDDPLLNQWERCDDMVTSWILHSLSRDIADSLQYVNNAAELWQELEDRYDQTNGAKLYQIQKEVSDLSQGSMDITTYYTKMKRLWEELGTLDNNNQCNCVCICGAKIAMYKAEQDRRLIQFLMGLNEVYTVVRGSILMMNPLPTIAQGFSILIQEEKQREVKPHNYLATDSTALSAYGNNQFRTNYSQNTAGNKSNQQFHRGSSSGIRMFCDYCKRPGHIKDKCYRLHGFPPNFKFTKGRNTASAAAVLGESNEALDSHLDEPGTLRTDGNLTLTKEQQTQLLHLLGSFQSGSLCTGSDNITSGAANFAGPFTEEASGNW
ncbi:uncharacterized protein LOC125862912 [Solanum stenotomum]|uniref:uncharacterized protein LOC125862912 n=1 Tax=Solanum stenotomum TaxID=172797 RepID=UPI0020CFFAFE|nr:uncharacterized protein LOC125862912 [Solanum stenotomum]